MPDEVVEVAVLIVAYNSREDIGECLSAVLASDDAAVNRHVVIVDNASSDGSAEYVARHFPQVDLLKSEINLGFAGGNNLGWDHIRRKYPNVDYLALLNPDTEVADGWLDPLASCLQQNSTVGAVQSKLLIHAERDVINSAGNRSHFMGFGFVAGWGQTDRGQYDRQVSIDFASGAAMMVRSDLLERLGLFDERMFLYLEDADLSWKIRQLGFEILFVPESVVYHKYDFHKNYDFYYYFERNRWWLLLSYYKAATLALLAPALAMMELGQMFFALGRGVLSQKLRSYGFFLQPGNLAALMRRRREIQRRRAISDRQFLSGFSGSVDFSELRSGLLKYVANPLFRAYWWAARQLIFW